MGKKVGFAAAALAAAVSVSAAASVTALDSRYEVVRYVIRSRRIERRTRLAVAADLHSEPDPKRRARLIELLRAEAPDLILMPGDAIHHMDFVAGAPAFLRRAGRIAPILCSMGNHECREDESDESRALLRRAGARVLDGEWVLSRGLVIAGLDDPDAPQYSEEGDWKARAEAVFAPLRREGRFRVLLSHRPDLVRGYAALPFDLVLSGHAHGGQVRLPGLIDGLYAPDQGIFPRWTGGMYRHGRVLHIVSKGLAVDCKPRVFNRPELTVVDLEPVSQIGT